MTSIARNVATDLEPHSPGGSAATAKNDAVYDGRWALLFFILVLGSTWFWPRVARSVVVQWSFLAATLGCLFAFAWGKAPPFKMYIKVRKPHWIQMCTQPSIYIYWALYVPEVIDQLPLIGAQVALAYALDGLLNWRRRGEWELGFGPLPVVGSLNLFLWARDEWWFLQIGMLLLAFFGREWIRWQRHGRSAHIFNPSGLALFVIAIGVLLTDSTEITWGQFIATTLNAPDHMFETLFLAGIVVQALFSTTLVTLAAASTIWVGSILCFKLTGEWFFFDTHIPISVFLGLTLLITDPATSPRNGAGKFLFGMFYGLCVFPLWQLLLFFGQPTYFDKLLQVPLMNLCVPLLERWGESIERRLAEIRNWRILGQNPAHVVIWSTLFLFLRPGLVAHPGADSIHGYMLLHGHGAGASKKPADALALFQRACDGGQMSGCNQLAIQYMDGGLVTQDFGAAVNLFRKACRLRDMSACTNLGARYFKGEGVPIDTQRAAELYEKACDGDEMNGCANLALMHLYGDGMPRDHAQGVRLLDRACEKGHFGACNDLARDFFQRNTQADRRKAVDYATRACDGEVMDACMNLGLLYLHGGPVEKDASRARALFGLVCNSGAQIACQQLQAMGDSRP